MHAPTLADLGNEILPELKGLLLLLLGLGLSESVQVEAQGSDLAAQLLSCLSPAPRRAWGLPLNPIPLHTLADCTMRAHDNGIVLRTSSSS